MALPRNAVVFDKIYIYYFSPIIYVMSFNFIIGRYGSLYLHKYSEAKAILFIFN